MKLTWCQNAASDFQLIHVPSERGEGLGLDCIQTGGNSGHQAVNLAYLFGASRICLLGFDMQSTGGQAHWHGSHGNGDDPTSGLFAKWRQNMNNLHRALGEQGVELINCTRDTALEIPRMDIEACLSA